MSTIKNAFADKLKEIMGEMTVRAFADRLGKSPSTLQEYLKGRVPPADFVALVCDCFNVSADWFLFGKGPKHKNAFAVEEDQTPYRQAVAPLPEKHLRLIKAFDVLDEVRQNRIVFAAEDAALAFEQIRGKEIEGNASRDSKLERKSAG